MTKAQQAKKRPARAPELPRTWTTTGRTAHIELRHLGEIRPRSQYVANWLKMPAHTLPHAELIPYVVARLAKLGYSGQRLYCTEFVEERSAAAIHR